MKIKKFLAAFLSAAMVITSAAVPVLADEPSTTPPDSWADVEMTVAPEGYKEVSGTDHDVEISSEEGLAWFAKQVNEEGNKYTGKKVVLTADIDTSDYLWTPIGRSLLLAFGGIFDGDGHEVKINVNTDEKYCGLFGYVSGEQSRTGTTYAEIKNVGVSGKVVTSETIAGGIAGDADETKIKNCYNKCTVVGSGMVGGIVGQGYESEIEGCYNEGTVSADGQNAGGIVGYISYMSSIKHCYNLGTVVGGSEKPNETPGDGGGVGGIVGDGGNIFDSTTIEDCFNLGAVRGTSIAKVGGVAGKGNKLSGTYYLEGTAQVGLGTTDEDIDTQAKKIGGLSELQDMLDNSEGVWIFDDEGGVPDLKDNLRTRDDGYSFYASEIGVYFIVNDSIDSDNEDALESRTYDIVLHAKSGAINRLNAVDITFDNEGSDMGYTISPANEHISVSNPVAEEPDRYLFNFDTKTETEIGNSDTAPDIKIGTVTFSGYGKVDFRVASTDSNAVQTTKQNDNIVDTFISGGKEQGLGDLVVNTPLEYVDSYLGTIEGQIYPEEKEIEINVMFPNMIEFPDDTITNGAEYTAMKVIVENSAGTFRSEIPLKEISYRDSEKPEGFEEGYVLPYYYTDYKGSGKYLSSGSPVPANAVANGYQINMQVPVPEGVGSRYTFKFIGEGYRTYTVDAVIAGGDDTHVINVWNNAMDDKHVVTQSDGFDDVEREVTFLAGDIDNSQMIDLYDLSAAVAYFGKSNKPVDGGEYDSAYVQYDLNRDGSIDSKDIAMVLVSWGK